jgi:hypothetical protein
MLKNDPSLTSQQKSHLDLRGTSDLSNGFLGALTEGNTRIVTEIIDGGPERGGYMRMGAAPGVWEWENGTLWLRKWGAKPKQNSNSLSKDFPKEQQPRAQFTKLKIMLALFALLFLATGSAALILVTGLWWILSLNPQKIHFNSLP